MKGSHLINTVVLLKAWEKWRLGWSKVYQPEINAMLLSVSFCGKKRKYTFTLLRKARAEELEPTPKRYYETVDR